MRGLPRSVLFIVCAVMLWLAPAVAAAAAPGDLLWFRSVPLKSSLHLSDPSDVRVAVAGTGDVFVVGEVTNAGDEADLVVARYSSGGTRKWVRVFDAGGDDILGGVAADRIGNVVVCGADYSAARGYVFCAVKYTRLGKRSWVRRLDGPTSMDWAKEVVVDDRGSAYVAGIYGKTADATRM